VVVLGVESVLVFLIAQKVSLKKIGVQSKFSRYRLETDVSNQHMHQVLDCSDSSAVVSCL
jgi:hypothetical protein